MLSVGQPGPTVSAPLRLDPSFNARSPANPMTWDLEVAPSGISPLLAQQHVYQPPVPPTIPQDLSASLTSVLPTLSSPAKRPRDSKPEGRASLPPLPNYRAPPHPVSMYGIIPSTAPSSDDEDQLPTGSLTAPLEALAQAASEAHVEMNPADHRGSNGDSEAHQRRKRRKPMPPPPNAFPDVVTRGLVTDACCRQIFDFFMSSCLPFWPILDPQYDTYESLRDRSPWSINAIVMVGATRISDSRPEFRQAAEHGLEEAHGIARSSLFGPTVRLEGCQAMGIVAAWQTGNSPYMAAGHALRMSMELGLHRALGKLTEDAAEGRIRSQTEQRSLTSSGRPHSVHEELVSADKLQVFLQHPLSIVSDKFLVANYELMACRNRIDAMSSAFAGRLDARALEFARRSARDLNAWWSKWDATLGAQRFSMTIKIALDRFARHFEMELPSQKAQVNNLTVGTADTSSTAHGPAASFGFANTGTLPFDVASLPNSDWVGADLFPEWIKGETSDQDWTFDSAWTNGIDRLFLPQWSTGVVESSAVEW
ncbi:hypothetical protein OIV83_001560 [Microbotryomycetes sp. JL201]|nr:hypothetical protein OIV83_001560 [Microbotryomycetes sp. JL201]